MVEFGIREKVKDLRAGLDKNGEPLRAIAPKTRKYRRSAMTPSGKGDPDAPPLIPGWMKSRTISLLAGRAFADHAEFYWRYDAWTGDTWGKILAIQAARGRDVIGLSPMATERVRVAAWRRWAAWKRGAYPVASPSASRASAAAIAVPQVGSYDMTHATFGIGASGPEAFQQGQWAGGMTRAEWDAWFRGQARAAIPGRPNPRVSPHPDVGAGYNRILQHTWGNPTRPPEAPRQPMPSPKPKPKPRPPSFDWSAVIDPRLPAYRSARASAEREQAGALSAIAAELGIPEAEARRKLAASLGGAVRSAELYVRVDRGDLPKILASGRFKTQFETGNSGGAFAPAERSVAEEQVFGTPQSIDPKLRPIYGYGSAPGFADYHSPNERMVSGYGPVAIRLKPSVRARTTFTAGDSLGYPDIAQGSPVESPDIRSFPMAYYHHRRLAKHLIGTARPPAGRLRMIQEDVSYLEMQYHGGVTVDDIAEVGFDRPPPQSVADALAARGIPWRVIPRP